MPIEPLSDEETMQFIKQLRAYAQILEAEVGAGTTTGAKRALRGASMAIKSLREHWTV